MKRNGLLTYGLTVLTASTSHEYAYIGKRFFADNMWAPNAAGPFIQEHLKSLMDYPPRQKADTLSIKKALENAMEKMQTPNGSSN